jgi:hypothetical protein
LDNNDVDHLAWIASSRALTPHNVIIEKLSKPLLKPIESTSEVIRQDLMVIDEPEQEPGYDWMYLIKMFLDNQPPSDDSPEVERIMRKSMQCHLIKGILFQWSTNGMMMKCISREEGIQLLWDILSGIHESHSSWRSIIGKAFRHGFYWPTAKDDAMEIVTKYRDGQFFQKQTIEHANSLRPIDLS